MGVDRKNYVMSAEIAMAREMSYRNKLQRLSGETSSSNITDPIHSQVPTPAPYERPVVPPCPTQPSFPRPHTGMTHTWNPTLSTNQITTSGPMWRPINVADQKKKGPITHDKPAQLGNFFCLVCQIDCTTSYNLMMHYKGQRHMAKLMGLGEPKGKKVPGGSTLSTAKDRLYCKLCGIWCKDEYTFRFHLQCKNHVLSLQEVEKKMKKPRTS